MNAVLAVTLAYFVGSIPFAYLLSRHQGIDLRRTGSGNVGASNVLRTTGVRAAVLAMVLDGVKGTVAVLVAQLLSAVGRSRLSPRPVHRSSVTCTRSGFGSAVGKAWRPRLVRSRCWRPRRSVLPRRVPARGRRDAIHLSRLDRRCAHAHAGGRDQRCPGAVAIGASVSTLIIIYRHRANLARLVAGTERRIGQRVVNETVR